MHLTEQWWTGSHLVPRQLNLTAGQSSCRMDTHWHRPSRPGLDDPETYNQSSCERAPQIKHQLYSLIEDIFLNICLGTYSHQSSANTKYQNLHSNVICPAGILNICHCREPCLSMLKDHKKYHNMSILCYSGCL